MEGADMNADALQAARAAGVHISMDGGDLVLEAAGGPRGLPSRCPRTTGKYRSHLATPAPFARSVSDTRTMSRKIGGLMRDMAL
jgi:hypothetical protein